MHHRRLHPLLTHDALPDIEIPLAEPHVPRKFRLPSCIGREPQAPLRIEAERDRRNPTRSRSHATSRWFKLGETMVLPVQPDEDELDTFEDDEDHPGHRLALRLALLVLVLAGIALVSVILAT